MRDAKEFCTCTDYIYFITRVYGVKACITGVYGVRARIAGIYAAKVFITLTLYTKSELIV